MSSKKGHKIKQDGRKITKRNSIKRGHANKYPKGGIEYCKATRSYFVPSISGSETSKIEYRPRSKEELFVLYFEDASFEPLHVSHPEDLDDESLKSELVAAINELEKEDIL